MGNYALVQDHVSRLARLDGVTPVIILLISLLPCFCLDDSPRIIR